MLTENVRSRGHDKLTTHGILKDVPKADLRDWVYQLLSQEVLTQASGEFPLLKLNAASWAVMEGKQTVRLIQLDRGKKAKRTGEKGDLLGVPRGTTHWFDMGTKPSFTAIRFFHEEDGWIGNFTGAAISSRFPDYDTIAAGYEADKGAV